MRKLLAPDPASISRPNGPAFDDAVDPAYVTGTPGRLRADLTGLVGEGQVLHRVPDLVRYASDARPHGTGKRPTRPGGQPENGQTRGTCARPRPAQPGPATAAVLTSRPDGPGPDPVWIVAALVPWPIAREGLSNPHTTDRAIRHALDLAGPDQVLVTFLHHPPPDLPDSHDRHPSTGRPPTGPAHEQPAPGPPAGADRPAPPAGPPARRLEAPTRGETRILRYLPTHLSAGEIADELCLSVNTVKTHQRHLYAKLGARSRTQAVAQARALGLLAPPPRKRSQHTGWDDDMSDTPGR